MILAVEAGIFPLMCGWWIDICSFVSIYVLFEACGVLADFYGLNSTIFFSSLGTFEQKKK